MAEIPEKLIPVYIEKYKILWAAFDNEMGRFWQRYNILFSIQIVAVSLFKLTETATVKPLVLIAICSVLSLLSLITVLIVKRAIDVYKINLEMITKFENDHSDFKLLTKEMKNPVDKLSPKSYDYALILPFVLFVFWAIFVFFKICEVYNI